MESSSDQASAPWIQQYEGDLSTYQVCAEKLEQLIRDLLTNAGIDLVDVESRAKAPDSLLRKVEGKREGYNAPLEDVTDLIGVRVIAYYLEDVDQINETIAREFEVDQANSADKLNDLEPDRFGYRSVHHIVTIGDSRSNLSEYAVFDKKKAEIQVRTATQHAWAAVEHKLNYKRTSEAPRDLRRRLMRLSALFELADDQFSAVKAQLEKLEAQYSSDVRGGNLDLPIDTSSVEAFLEDGSALPRIVKQAEGSGFRIAAPDSDNYQGRVERDVADLVTFLHTLGIEKIADLSAILEDQQSMDQTIEQLAAGYKEAIIVWRSPVDLLTLLLCFQQGIEIEALEEVYNDAVTSVIKDLRGKSGRAGQD